MLYPSIAIWRKTTFAGMVELSEKCINKLKKYIYGIYISSRKEINALLVKGILKQCITDILNQVNGVRQLEYFFAQFSISCYNQVDHKAIFGI